MIFFILVALFVLFFAWGGAFIEGRHSFENTYFKGALITKYLLQGGRSFEGALFRGNTVSQVSFKVVRAIGYIKYARKFLPRETSRMLYLGLVEPHFRYCCSVWGSCGSVKTKKLKNCKTGL